VLLPPPRLPLVGSVEHQADDDAGGEENSVFPDVLDFEIKTPEVVAISKSSDGSSSTRVVPMPLKRTRVVLVGGGGAEEFPRFCDRRPKQVFASPPTTVEIVDGDDDAGFEDDVVFFLPPLKETDDRADLSTGG
jgi:hypothetical protein